MLKKVFYNTGAQIAGKAITASSTLVLTVIIGRSLGPAGYGDFVKIFTFVGYFYIFTDLGLNQTFIKISQKNNDHSLVHYLTGFRVVLAIILAGTAIIISHLMPYHESAGTGFSPMVKAGIMIASATIFTQAMLTSLNSYFQLRLRYDLSAIAVSAGSLITLALTLIVLNLSPALNKYVLSYTIGAAVVIFIAWALIIIKLKIKIKPQLSFIKIKILLNQSWPIGIALILNMIYFRSDIFVLTYTRPPEEVGIYGLAYQFFEATLAVPIFFANSLFPVLVKVNIENLNDYKDEVRRWFKLFLLVSLVITTLLILASFILPFLFEKFLGSQTALVILALGLPFFFVTAYLWHLAIISNKQRSLIPIYFVGGTINVILNIIFIPIYGFLAAAVITVLCEALITLLLFIALKNKNSKNMANHGAII